MRPMSKKYIIYIVHFVMYITVSLIMSLITTPPYTLKSFGIAMLMAIPVPLPSLLFSNRKKKKL